MRILKAYICFVIIIFIFLTVPFVSIAKEYIVTNTNSSGPGSLSQAIEDLNSSGDEEENKIIFEVLQEPNSTDPLVFDTSLPPIKKPVTFKNDPGVPIKINSSNNGVDNVYGIFADKSFAIDDLSGTVEGVSKSSSFMQSVSRGYGLYAGSDISIRILSGLVKGETSGVGVGVLSGDGHAHSYGLYVKRDITIGTLSGDVTGKASGGGFGLLSGSGGAHSYGLYSGRDITISTLSGDVTGKASGGGFGLLSGSGDAHSYGLYAGNDIIIGTLSGSVEGGADGGKNGFFVGSSDPNSYGLYSGRDISIGTLSGSVEGGAYGAGFGLLWGSGDAHSYGLYSGRDISIGTLSGSVGGEAGGLGGLLIGSGGAHSYGLYSGRDISIGTLSGSVKGKTPGAGGGLFCVGNAHSYGLYSGRDIIIGTISGSVKGKIPGVGGAYVGIGNAHSYGLYAKRDISIGTLSGSVTGFGTAFGGLIGIGKANGYGLYADHNISIGMLTGEVKAESKNNWLRFPFVGNDAYGIYAKGTLNGGAPDIPLYILGTVSAAGPGDAIAIRSGGAMNIYVTGTLRGEDTSWFSWLSDDGYAIYGGEEDDIVSLDTGATIIGKIDLRKGNNTLNLFGSNSLDSYFTNITNLNVGGGIRGAYWSINEGAKGIHFKNTRINRYGILEVNTDISSNISIATDAILTGSGSIVGDVTNDGILLPFNIKNAIGNNNSLTIYGNYTHNPNAIFMVRANNQGEADRLYVKSSHWYSSGGGIATLKGGTVSVLADNGVYKKDTKYTILSADKIDGKFKNVETNLAFLDPSLDYDNKNIYLTLTHNNKLYSDVAQTEIQKNIAYLFDKAQRDKDKTSIIDALNSLSASQAKRAYDQMAGYSYSSAASISSSSQNQHMDIMKNRMYSFISGGPSSAISRASVMPSFCPDALYNVASILASSLNALGINVDPSQRGLFIQQYGGMLTERTQDNVSLRYDHTTAGYLIGFDTEVSPSALVGGAIGYSYTGLNMNEFGDNTGTKGYQASLYGTYTQGPFYLNGILGYGYNYYDTKREIVLPGFNNAAKASYEGHLMSGHVEVGYKIPVSFLDINPLAGIKHSYFMRDGFTESGADLISLIVGKQEYSSLISSLGVRLKKTIDMSQTQSITSEIRFHWDRELFNNDYGTNVSLSGFTGSSFKLTNKRPDRNMFVTGISLISQQTENLSFYISCDSSFSSGEPLHTGTLELRYRW